MIALFALALFGASVQDPEPLTLALEAIAREQIVPVYLEPSADGTPAAHVGHGPGYTVRFNESMAFEPRGTTDRPTPPTWKWTTLGAEIGAQSLDLDVFERRAEPRRVEIDRGAWIEAYDLRHEGVEQSFVLPVALPQSGDWVVRGRIDAAMGCSSRAPRHAELGFCSQDGTEIVRYGAAFVVDATGRREAIDTAFQEGVIELRVPGTFLRQAQYPVTLDPLLSSRLLVANGPASACDIAHDPVNRRFLVVYGRRDAFSHPQAILVDEDLSLASVRLVLDYTLAAGPADSEPHPQCVYVGGPNPHFAICFQRQGSVWLVRRAATDLGLQDESAAVAITPPMLGGTPSQPALGGGVKLVDGVRGAALAVWTEGDPFGARILGRWLDVERGLYGNSFQISPNPAANQILLRAAPCVSSQDDPHAMVCWQELDLTAVQPVWRIAVARVTANANLSASVTAAPAGNILSGGDPTRHATRPRVDGRGEDWVAIFNERTNLGVGDALFDANPWGEHVSSRRFVWGASQPSPALTVYGGLLSRSTRTVQGGDIAFDTRGRSHWTAVVIESTQRVRGIRLGHDGLVTEIADAWSSTNPTPTTGSIVYDRNADDWTLLWGLSSGNLRARRMTYQTPVLTRIGLACGTGRVTNQGLPRLGNQFFAAGFDSAPPFSPGAFWLSLGPGAFDLSGAGATGCGFFLDPITLLFAVPIGTDGSGAFSVPFALPSAPWTLPDLYIQFGYFSPGLNPLGFATTEALQIGPR